MATFSQNPQGVFQAALPAQTANWNIPPSVRARILADQMLTQQAADTSTPVLNTGVGVAKMLAGGIGGMLEGRELNNLETAQREANAEALSAAYGLPPSTAAPPGSLPPSSGADGSRAPDVPPAKTGMGSTPDDTNAAPPDFPRGGLAPPTASPQNIIPGPDIGGPPPLGTPPPQAIPGGPPDMSPTPSGPSASALARAMPGPPLPAPTAAPPGAPAPAGPPPPGPAAPLLPPPPPTGATPGPVPLAPPAGASPPGGGAGAGAGPMAAPASPMGGPDQTAIMHALQNPYLAPEMRQMLISRLQPWQTMTREDGSILAFNPFTQETRQIAPPVGKFSFDRFGNRVLNQNTGTVAEAPQPSPQAGAPFPGAFKGPDGNWYQRNPEGLTQPVQTPAYQTSVEAGKTGVQTAADAQKRIQEDLFAPMSTYVRGEDKTDMIASNQQQLKDLAVLKTAVQNINANGQLTGYGQQEMTQLKGAVNSLAGVFGLQVPADVSSQETLGHFNRQLAAAQQKSIGSRSNQMEFANFLQSNPGVETSIPGNLKLIDIMQQNVQRNYDIGLQLRQWATDNYMKGTARLNPNEMYGIINTYDQQHPFNPNPDISGDLKPPAGAPAAPAPNAPPVQPNAPAPSITQQQYNALPKGARYQAPDGSMRVKQ